jgi:LmbE family N-acetylglucosaminyl deacetylase
VRSRRLAVVYAHPDDDTYSVGGTIALHVPDGLEVMVVLATSGEAGPIADPSLANRETLGRVREAEARAALAVLGAKGAEVHFLRYPDGGLAEVDPRELTARVAELLDAFQPEVVATFGAEGITKHEDHIAIHQAATEAFHTAHTRAKGGSVARLLYNAIPRSQLERWAELVRESGTNAFDPEDPYQPRAVPDEAIAVSVDCGEAVGLKVQALRAHRTQAAELEEIPEDAYSIVFGHEHFVQAYPPRQPGDPVLGDVFEGLGKSGKRPG